MRNFISVDVDWLAGKLRKARVAVIRAQAEAAKGTHDEIFAAAECGFPFVRKCKKILADSAWEERRRYRMWRVVGEGFEVRCASLLKDIERNKGTVMISDDFLRELLYWCKPNKEIGELRRRAFEKACVAADVFARERTSEALRRCAMETRTAMFFQDVFS